MTATLIFLLLFLLGLFLALKPLLGPKEPFPEPPRREELLEELEVLKREVEALEGEEKKLALARMVELERALEGYRPPEPRPFNPLPVALVLGAVVLLGVGLWRYTLPRLPGETTVTARAEARELKALSDKAKKTGAVEDLLAWGRKAFELGVYEQTAEAYLEVLKKDPQNVEAVRRVGILLFLSGRPEEARLFLEIAQHASLWRRRAGFSWATSTSRRGATGRPSPPGRSTWRWAARPGSASRASSPWPGPRPKGERTGRASTRPAAPPATGRGGRGAWGPGSRGTPS
jgi:tetratricopeptide (TPR) repeat protein